MKRLKKKEDGNKIITLKEGIQGLLITIVFILMLSFCSIVETTYTRKATVTKVKNNIILFEDNCGHVWEVNGYDFSVGDKVKLIMDNNHTDFNINDDIIKKIKKIK